MLNRFRGEAQLLANFVVCQSPRQHLPYLALMGRQLRQRWRDSRLGFDGEIPTYLSHLISMIIYGIISFAECT